MLSFLAQLSVAVELLPVASRNSFASFDRMLVFDMFWYGSGRLLQHLTTLLWFPGWSLEMFGFQEAMECHGFEAGYVEGRQRPLGFDAEAPARSYSRLEVLLCGQGRGQIGIWSISETYVDLKWFELSPLPRENFDTLTLRVLEGSRGFSMKLGALNQLRPASQVTARACHRTSSYLVAICRNGRGIQWQHVFQHVVFFSRWQQRCQWTMLHYWTEVYRGVQSTGVTVVTLWCRQGVNCTVVIDSFARFSRRCCEQCCTRRTRCIPDASCSILAQWVQWKGSTDPGQYKHLTFLTHSRTKFFNVTCLK